MLKSLGPWETFKIFFKILLKFSKFLQAQLTTLRLEAETLFSFSGPQLLSVIVCEPVSLFKLVLKILFGKRGSVTDTLCPTTLRNISSAYFFNPLIPQPP